MRFAECCLAFVMQDVGNVCRLKDSRLDRGSQQYIDCPAAGQHQDDAFTFV